MSGGPSGARILVVDDEPGILRALKANLAGHGFEVETASTGEGGLAAIARERPELVILDLGLPDMDGIEVISRIRSQGRTPILVLSVRGGERDKVAALDLGADDYLTKPFGVEELLARVRVVLRHAAGPAGGTEPTFRTGDLEVDIERRRVRVGKREVHLTPTEYDLLRSPANVELSLSGGGPRVDMSLRAAAGQSPLVQVSGEQRKAALHPDSPTGE